jgi:hypothetical protein
MRFYLVALVYHLDAGLILIPEFGWRLSPGRSSLSALIEGVFLRFIGSGPLSRVCLYKRHVTPGSQAT